MPELLFGGKTTCFSSRFAPVARFLKYKTGKVLLCILVTKADNKVRVLSLLYSFDHRSGPRYLTECLPKCTVANRQVTSDPVFYSSAVFSMWSTSPFLVFLPCQNVRRSSMVSASFNTWKSTFPSSCTR